MNEWIKEWMSEWMNEQMNEWVNKRKKEWMNEWTNELKRMMEMLSVDLLSNTNTFFFYFLFDGSFKSSVSKRVF